MADDYHGNSSVCKPCAMTVLGDAVMCSFRNGFKYAFRWLPRVTWNPNDAISAESDEQPAAEVNAGDLLMSEGANVHVDSPQYSDVVAGAKSQPAEA
jgi:hypothetical protein